MSSFIFSYRVCLADTDAAGVVYFSRLLEICHRAYEAALAEAGIELAAFLGPEAAIALPVIQVEARFWAPLHCGDRLAVRASPVAIDRARFAVDYQVFLATAPDPAATARTSHACIDPRQRCRQPLPAALQAWIANRGATAGELLNS